MSTSRVCPMCDSSDVVFHETRKRVGIVLGDECHKMWIGCRACSKVYYKMKDPWTENPQWKQIDQKLEEMIRVKQLADAIPEE